jgi:hypothetical protein
MRGGARYGFDHERSRNKFNQRLDYSRHAPGHTPDTLLICWRKPMRMRLGRRVLQAFVSSADVICWSSDQTKLAEQQFHTLRDYT